MKMKISVTLVSERFLIWSEAEKLKSKYRIVGSSIPSALPITESNFSSESRVPRVLLPEEVNLLFSMGIIQICDSANILKNHRKRGACSISERNSDFEAQWSKHNIFIEQEKRKQKDWKEKNSGAIERLRMERKKRKARERVEKKKRAAQSAKRKAKYAIDMNGNKCEALLIHVPNQCTENTNANVLKKKKKKKKKNPSFAMECPFPTFSSHGFLWNLVGGNKYNSASRIISSTTPNLLMSSTSILPLSLEQQSRCIKKIIAKKKIAVRCFIFNDLWNRGYYITGGQSFGVDFLVYPGDPVNYHSSLLVVVLQKSMSSLLGVDLVAYCRLATQVKKSILLASVIKDDDELDNTQCNNNALGDVMKKRKILYHTIEWQPHLSKTELYVPTSKETDDDDNVDHMSNDNDIS